MKHTLKSIVCALLLAGLLAGCYGSFNLTRKVWKFNGEVGGKWVNEVVFLAMNIVPVYSLAGFVDAVILNTIEFWTGSNPVTAENAQPTNLKNDDGTTVTFNSQDKVMEITSMIPGRGETTYRVVHENGQSVVKDKDNNILVRCIAGDDGGMTLLDVQGNVLHSYSSTQVEAMAMK